MSDSFKAEFLAGYRIAIGHRLARRELSRSLNKHEERWIADGWTPATLHTPEVRDDA
ncbi:MAG: hypothetical protein HQRvContig02_47 [Haloquadratum phage sp.]|nr:MAG: hypothetical protein HQRvContig02_47 [Haloquadratum phage sp.]